MQVVVQDLITHYEKQGDGETLLLLHGWGDKLETFEPLLPSLSERFTVLRLDLPGFGKSQKPPVAWNLDDYARFTRDFLEKLEGSKQPYGIIGHSNGGALVIRGISLGLLKPQRLVLLAASGVRNTGTVRRFVIKLIAKTGKILTFWLPSGTKQKLQKKLYGTVGSDMLVSPELQETFKRTVRQDIQEDAAKLKLPTLLIYGENDKATPVDEVGSRLHRLLEKSELKTVAGADHFVHLAAPAEVSRLILGFLK